MMQPKHLLYKIAENLIDKLYFQQRFTADEIQHHTRRFRRCDISVRPFVCGKQHTDHDLLEHLREFEHFFGLVLSGNRHIRLFTLSGLTPVNGI